jgi:hypothetical protein
MTGNRSRRFIQAPIIGLECPIRVPELPPIDPDCKTVQLAASYSQGTVTKPTDSDFEAAAEYLKDHPRIIFRVFDRQTTDNLEYLRFFKNHRRFWIDLYLLQDVSGVRHLADGLESLFLGATKATIDLSFLQRFGEIKELHLEHHRKNIKVLSGLTNLEYLSLRSITLDDLSILLPLHKLLELEIRLGGTKNLDLLGEIGKIRYLHLWKILGLSDISPIGRVATLQNLFLQALPRVTKLPELSFCKLLRRIVLYQMNGISDLEALSRVASLRELAILSMAQLSAQSFSPLSALTLLDRVDIWLRNKKKHGDIFRILGPVVSDTSGEFSSLSHDNFDYQ